MILGLAFPGLVSVLEVCSKVWSFLPSHCYCCFECWLECHYGKSVVVEDVWFIFGVEIVQNFVFVFYAYKDRFEHSACYLLIMW